MVCELHLLKKIPIKLCILSWQLESLVLAQSHLSDASRTKPVPVWNSGDFGSVAVCVTAFITAVAKEKQFFVISLSTDLAVL